MNFRSTTLLLIAVVCIGFAGASSAALAQHSTIAAKSDKCAPIEWTGPAEQMATSPGAGEIFQNWIDEAAQDLSKGLRGPRPSVEQRRGRAEFVLSNMLFVAVHELGHALVSELDLVVLGREEDVADAYATLGMLKCGADFSRRVLVEAAKGWFMNAQRDKKAGEVAHYYERHGLDEQRAYQIVCLMVGSDPVGFRDLADESGLPEGRRRSCSWDYDTASRSWDRALGPHRRAADRARTPVQVVYSEGKGAHSAFARVFSSIRFLEAIVERVVDRFVWPAPITVEMRSCGEPNARWTIPTRTLHICYELAQEFLELYRDFGGGRTLAAVRGATERLSAARPQNIAQSVGAWRRSKQAPRSAR
jgi:hypothetical protein